MFYLYLPCFIFIFPYTGEMHQHVQRLTLSVVDTFIEDLKSSVREAKGSPSGKGTMVAVYGAFLFRCRYYRAMSPFAFLSIIRDVSVILFYSCSFSYLAHGDMNRTYPLIK